MTTSIEPDATEGAPPLMKAPSTRQRIVAEHIFLMTDYDDAAASKSGQSFILYTLFILAIVYLFASDPWGGISNLLTENLRLKLNDPLDRTTFLLAVVAYGLVSKNTFDYLKIVGRLSFGSNNASLSRASILITVSIVWSMLMIFGIVILSLFSSPIFKVMIIAFDLLGGAVLFLLFYAADRELLKSVQRAKSGKLAKAKTYLLEQIQFIDVPGVAGFLFVSAIVISVMLYNVGHQDFSGIDKLKAAAFGATAIHLMITQVIFEVLALKGAPK